MAVVILFAVVDTTIVFIINGNEGSGDTDRGRRRRRRIYNVSVVVDTIS